MCPDSGNLFGKHTQTAMDERSCWNCGKPSGEEHFCPGCGKLQPHRGKADYFHFFGLPRKLILDLEALEISFYALSRKLHPDNFYRASEGEKQASLDKTAILNDAYRTLKEPVSRAHYLLELEGEKGEGSQKSVPPELLEEVFELNEWLAELKLAGPEGQREDGQGAEGHLREVQGQLEKAKAKFESQVEDFHQELQEHSASWDRSVDSFSTVAGSAAEGKHELLARLGQLLSRRNYLRNLLRDVDAALSVNGNDTRFGERKKNEQAVPKLEIKLESR